MSTIKTRFVPVFDTPPPTPFLRHYTGDPDVSPGVSDTELNMATAILKLPEFWETSASVWFAQTEAQFDLHGILDDTARYYHVVSALGSSMAARESLVTLDRSISYTFANEGMYSLTVQVAAANTIFQDSKTIAVREFFKSLLLSFSPNLDEFNPDLSEWRQDLGRVIKKAILQVAKFPEEQLLVAVFPGVPTAAELFLLPHKSQSHDKKKSEEELQQVSNIIVNALNQNLVAFELKPGVRVIVYNTQLTLAPLVDSNHRHRSSAMLMLLSVVFLGLAVFLIYKFKRKIPWISIYAEVNQDKEQEMITSVDQGDNTAKITLNEFSSSKKLVEKEVDARVKRGVANAHESTREIPNCTSV